MASSPNTLGLRNKRAANGATQTRIVAPINEKKKLIQNAGASHIRSLLDRDKMTSSVPKPITDVITADTEVAMATSPKAEGISKRPNAIWEMNPMMREPPLCANSHANPAADILASDGILYTGLARSGIGT
jgi:hypothetical protein